VAAAAEAALEDIEANAHRDDALVVSILAAHAPALLRTARRYSRDADDAQDAYQRALEIFVRRAGRLRRETAVNWLHQVVKHEALAVREARGRLVAVEELPDADQGPSPEERVVALDRTARAAEALAGLKSQEVAALWLKAQGLSYDEIADRQAWTYTKVNRCLTEGRRAFLERFADIEAGDECRRWAPAVSALVDGEASSREAGALRTHLRHCPACRATVRELRAAGPSLAGVLPVGVAGAAMPQRFDGGFLARVYDAVASGLHDRVASSALKVQAAAEAASAGKLAAVAASAAALAGGGAITASETGVLHARATHAQHADGGRQAKAGTRARVASAAAAAPAPPPVAATTTAPRAPTSTRRATTKATIPRHARKRATEREFGFEGGPANGSASAPRVTASAASATGGGSAPATSAPRSRPAATNSSSEFGFEGG
jgi:RNA polymerase sigma factor (sigma-70 family)